MPLESVDWLSGKRLLDISKFILYNGFVMKVLKKGREQKGWAKEYECTGVGNGMGGCGAVLLVEQDDLFRTCSSDYTGDCEYYTTFQCCECKILTDIPRADYRNSRELPLKRVMRGHLVAYVD